MTKTDRQSAAGRNGARDRRRERIVIATRGLWLLPVLVADQPTTSSSAIVPSPELPSTKYSQCSNNLAYTPSIVVAWVPRARTAIVAAETLGLGALKP